MIEHPTSMTLQSCPGDVTELGIADGLVKISVGIEDFEEILADLERELEKV